MAERLVGAVALWVLFGIGFGFLPVSFSGLRAWMNGKSDWLTAAVGGGELFLIPATMCGASVGLLATSGPKLLILKYIVAGISVLIALFAALLYGDMTAAYRRPRGVYTRLIRNLSLIVFGMGFVVGTSSALLAEMSK